MEPPVIDRDKFIGEIARSHGILIGQDDPIWAVLALHWRVLGAQTEYLSDLVTEIVEAHDASVAATETRIQELLESYASNIDQRKTPHPPTWLVICGVALISLAVGFMAARVL